jgi:type VI secretion system protein ImpL
MIPLAQFQTADQLIDFRSIPLQQIVVPTAITIVCVIIFSAIAYFGFYKRWKKKRQEALIAAGGRLPIEKGSLVKVWKEFLRQIPTEFRRAILSYPPVVVLGEAGSGKSVLIGRYTDWKGQAAQFYPSYSQNPQLQIYLGSRTVVQEAPSALLYDYSQSARAALVRLWKPVFKYRDPVVVLAVSAAALKNATPDSLRTLAQTFRGKINVLSRIRGKPVKTRVVLTHMDQVEGFLAFSQFLDKLGVALKVDVSAPDVNMEACLEPYEKYIPLALMQLPAKAYMKVLTFLQKAPASLALVAVLLKTLRETDPLSYEPDITDLYLTSDTSGSPSAVSNPFASAFTGQGILAAATVRARHRVVASVAALASLVVLTWSYFTERVIWLEAERALARFDETHEPRWAKAVDTQLKELSGEADGSLVSWVRPRVFGKAVDHARARFTTTLRTRFLLPALERAANSTEAHDSSLYALGVIYATRDGDLGRFITPNAPGIAKALDLPEGVVTAYIDNSVRAWSEPLPLRSLPYEHKLSAANDLQPWLSYFIELQQAYDEKAHLTTADLAKLQAGARGLISAIEEVRTHDQARTIYRLLLAVQAIDPRPAFERYIEDLQIPEWITQHYTQAESLFQVVASTSMAIPPVETANLHQFINHLRGIRALPDRPAANHRFQIADRIFTYEAKKWQKLVERGRVRLLVSSFVEGKRPSDDPILFSEQGKSFPPIAMKPANRGDFIFSGRGVIDGPFTRAAYDREVKPVLLQFAGVVESLADEPDMQSSLSGFIERAVERYAADYEAACRRYYDAWEVRAESFGGLMILLDQLRLPVSSLTEMLQTVSDATDMVGGAEETSSPYLRIVSERLARFQYVNRIITADASGKTQAEYKNYRDILNRIHEDLLGVALADPTKEKEAPPKPGDPGRTPDEFVELLTPVGRAAFLILREDRDSYRKLVERWLASVGIEDWARRPFLAPVNELYALGKADIEASVRRSWETRVSAQLTSLLGKYPFYPKAEVEALPREVESVLHPNGTFWRAWRNLIAPVCVEEGGVWRPHPGTGADFRWPKEMFAVANHLSRLTRALYDEKGQPHPVAIEVLPRELPKPAEEGPVVILSFVSAGKGSVFGFNQKPDWQKLEWEWWSGQAASAGVQLEDRESEDRFYRQVTVQDSLWSLLRVLRRAQVFETSVWTFTLGTGDFKSVKVKFEFREDPWDLFSVPAVEQLMSGWRAEEPAAAPLAPGGKGKSHAGKVQ